jgi:NAD(P)-dependent dehydrogenase (short-subunit alcohol dehydrogenase family)
VSSTTEKPVVVITGGSAGIGKAAAAAFARMGWTVITTGRDPGRTAQAESELQDAAREGGGTVHMLRGDFCEMADVKRVASEIAALTPRIDVLINNAGGVRDKLYTSSEGLEATFAANHLAPFVLTRELLPILKATAAGSAPGTVRVIAVSSSGHEVAAGMNWGDLNNFTDFKTGPAYCQAKLANILFTRELDRRVLADGIVAQSMHPGVVASNFANHGDEFMQTYMAAAESAAPEQPARTLVWLSTAPEAGVDGGRYFHDCAEIEPAPQAKDDAAAKRLWDESEKILAGIGA